MKHPLTIYIAALLSIFTFAGCSSDDDGDCQGVDCLPAATQTGAGTFGCLVNGKPFVDNSGNFNCFYQFVGGEYYFAIAAEDEVFNISQIIVASNARSIVTDSQISLNSNISSEFYAEVSYDSFNPSSVTKPLNDGFVTFTRFSINPNIVSGTFNFTVTDSTTGQVYEITEGRFDSRFTQ